MVDKAHAATDRELARMERHLSAIYNRASKELGETWKNYLADAEAKLKPLQEAYDKAKESKDKDLIEQTGRALEAKKREMTLLDEHYKNLTEQLAQEITHINETATAYVNGQLPKIYSINYNAVGKDMQSQVKGISFELVDASTVKNLATTEKTLLPYKKVDGKKDVRWNTKRVNAEVLQGILQGESMDKIATRLAKVEKMNEASAIRNARTSVTSAENKGRMDMLHDAEEKGVLTHKVWMATEDDRTRDWHTDLDGVELEIDEYFENTIVSGKTSYRDKILYPGDPDADPANLYNCRCTLVYKVVGFEKVSE